MSRELPFHKTKIVATIGPASSSPAVLSSLIRSGMNVARLNFSHGTLEEQRKKIKAIYKTSRSQSRPIAILIDLPGPKIRIGKLPSEPLLLKKGDKITLASKASPGKNQVIPVNYSRLAQSIGKAGVIYLNDGFIQLKAEKVASHSIECRVITGGTLLSNKGLNIPGAKLPIDAITKKDLELLEFGLYEGVRIFCVSFVKDKSDILKAREFARKKGKKIYVVAKIERKEAVANIDQILSVSDAIMVARGDLGVEVPIEDVPGIQKKLIRKANLWGRPVITATQMLESMTDNLRPTRAEVTDVANAILDGTDAVMLSEETAIGTYPVEAVKMMVKIASSIEHQRHSIGAAACLRKYIEDKLTANSLATEDAISLNVAKTQEELRLRYILTPTENGNTARRVSRFKPSCWILAFSRNKGTCEFLNLSYGVFPFFIKSKTNDWHSVILKLLNNLKMLPKNCQMILTQGRFAKKTGGTDSYSIIRN